MDDYVTNDAQVVRNAVAHGSQVKWAAAYDEYLHQWHLHAHVVINERRVTFQGKGYRAVSVEAARRKAKTQLDRMLTGKNTAQPKLPTSFQDARKALKSKIEETNAELTPERPRIASFTVDWSNFQIKFKAVNTNPSVKPKDVLAMYEPELSAFSEELKSLPHQ